jgi:dUTP pyrophosphatase
MNNISAVLPKYETVYASCFDLVFCNPTDQNTLETYDTFNHKGVTTIIAGEITLYPGVRALIPTALKFDLSKEVEPTFWESKMGYNHRATNNIFSMKVYPRSGLSFKTGLGLINSVGIIDGDYVGQLMIPMINHAEKQVTLKVGDRIAQAEILKNGMSIRSKFVWRSTPPEEFGGRTGGFGSTGGFTTTPSPKPV